MKRKRLPLLRHGRRFLKILSERLFEMNNNCNYISTENINSGNENDTEGFIIDSEDIYMQQLRTAA